MTFGLIASVLVLATAIVTVSIMRQRVRRAGMIVQDIVRDPSRRMPTASLGGEMRELAHWINSLAEDVQRSRDALTHERTLLASVGHQSRTP
jgi:signal transduction histidine kinase